MRSRLLVLVAGFLSAVGGGWGAAAAGAGMLSSGSPWLGASELARYHLSPVPPIVLGTCAKMAARAGAEGVPLTVFCPPVVPDVMPIRRELAGGILRYRSYRDGYNAAFWSPPAHWAFNWGGHWTFAAGASRSLKVYVDPPGAPIHAVTTRRLRLGGIAVTLYSMSPTAPAFYAGHLVMAWRQSGKTFNLSVHGVRWRARLAAMTAALIREVRACSPSGQRPVACQAVLFPAKR